MTPDTKAPSSDPSISLELERLISEPDEKTAEISGKRKRARRAAGRTGRSLKKPREPFGQRGSRVFVKAE